MKKSENVKSKQSSDSTINPSLNKYKDKTPFPKKLALANEHLKGGETSSG